MGRVNDTERAKWQEHVSAFPQSGLTAQSIAESTASPSGVGALLDRLGSIAPSGSV